MPPLDLDALWSVAEAADHCHVTKAAIRSWVHRGHLKVAQRDGRGRPRFHPLDVARAEYHTRAKARRQLPHAHAA